MVTRVVNCCKMFDDCGCANKWEWVLVNSSQIGLISQRHKKPEDTENFLCTFTASFFSFSFLTAVQPQRHTPQYDEGGHVRGRIPVELEVKVCEEIKPGMHRCLVS